MKKGNDNPFYGKKELLNLYHVGSKTEVQKSEFLNALGSAYHSLQNKEQRELFYMLVFAFGDIPNRQHNIFGTKKIDGGGSGQRDAFLWAMEWMKSYQPAQYERFMITDLFRQYACLFNVLATQVRTKKGSTKVVGVLNMLDGTDLNKVADYIASIINGSNPVEKAIIAKWLVYPRTSKRQRRNKKGEIVKGGRVLNEETKSTMDSRVKLYEILSSAMGWAVIQHKHNKEFKGLREWKKEWNGDLESVLFSTGKIKEFDKEQFFKWLDILPAGARFRVRKRLLDKDNKLKGKWKSKDGLDLGNWFLNWEDFKKNKQGEQRELTEKVRQGTATEADKVKLEQVKKEAKVTTGGVNLFDTLKRMISGVSNIQEAEILAEAILNKAEFLVPVLMIADCSGSMHSRDGGIPLFMAQVLATLLLLKNPSPELDNVLVRFGNDAEFLTDNTFAKASATNRFMQSEMKQIGSLCDRKLSFIENYNRMRAILNVDMGGTRFDSVSVAFKRWIDSSTSEAEKRVRIEMIQSYPVFLVVSDGDFNGQGNAAQTMAVFQQNMRQWFGWEGVVVLWDVSTQHRSSFEGMQNVIHVKDGFNASTVNQIFTKIHDLDVIDVYTPLKSLFESNRYEPVKLKVL